MLIDVQLALEVMIVENKIGSTFSCLICFARYATTFSLVCEL